VNAHNFIFSDHIRYRISRHAIFWLISFVFILLSYHFPTAIFPDWNIQARMDFSTKKFGVDYVTLRGGWFKMIWEITYRQGLIFTSYIAFTYSVIYYILPGFMSDKKKWIAITGELILLFAGFLVIDYFLTYVTSIDTSASMVKQGIPGVKPDRNLLVSRTAVPATFNLVTIVGVAVTIKLMKRWWLKQRETTQVAKEKIIAELQLLKAQIHPHFLFNSLNNIYSFTLEGSPKAPEMIQKLSGLLHYMLYDCKQTLVPLEKELKMIEDYISLEKIRYGERLYLNVETLSPIDETGKMLIAPLLLIPFVENSFKHGTSKMLAHPRVSLDICIQNNVLFFNLVNSKPSENGKKPPGNNHGLGLKNVKKRLELLYPGCHELQIVENPSEYSAWLKIVLARQKEVVIKKPLLKQESVYDELS
jgi:Putative regulator of cell autolysis